MAVSIVDTEDLDKLHDACDLLQEIVTELGRCQHETMALSNRTRDDFVRRGSQVLQRVREVYQPQ